MINEIHIILMYIGMWFVTSIWLALNMTRSEDSFPDTAMNGFVGIILGIAWPIVLLSWTIGGLAKVLK